MIVNDGRVVKEDRSEKEFHLQMSLTIFTSVLTHNSNYKEEWETSEWRYGDGDLHFLEIVSE
jgi:hypothetical protein